MRLRTLSPKKLISSQIAIALFLPEMPEKGGKCLYFCFYGAVSRHCEGKRIVLHSLIARTLASERDCVLEYIDLNLLSQTYVDVSKSG